MTKDETKIIRIKDVIDNAPKNMLKFIESYSEEYKDRLEKAIRIGY